MVPGLKVPAQRIGRDPWSLFNGLSSALSLEDPPEGIFRIVAQVVAGTRRHTTVSGSLSIAGNGCTEALDFTANNQKRTSKAFLTAKPEITVSGLDCTLILTAIDKNGQTILQETTTNIKCRWDGSSARIQVGETSWKLCTAEIMTASFCQTGDIIRKGSKDYEVVRTKEFAKGSRIYLYNAWLAG
jgi:hypothetical protein